MTPEHLNCLFVHRQMEKRTDLLFTSFNGGVFVKEGLCARVKRTRTCVARYIIKLLERSLSPFWELLWLVNTIKIMFVLFILYSHLNCDFIVEVQQQTTHYPVDLFHQTGTPGHLTVDKERR